MKYNLKKPLNQYNLKTRQGLMARLSEIAYQDKKTATAYAKSVGFTKTQFFDLLFLFPPQLLICINHMRA